MGRLARCHRRDRAAAFERMPTDAKDCPEQASQWNERLHGKAAAALWVLSHTCLGHFGPEHSGFDRGGDLLALPLEGVGAIAKREIVPQSIEIASTKFGPWFWPGWKNPRSRYANRVDRITVPGGRLGRGISGVNCAGD